MKSDLTIQDLPLTWELDRDALKATHGGIGRTPAQIRAGEETHLPATWDGRVLGGDGQLYLPGDPRLPQPQL